MRPQASVTTCFSNTRTAHITVRELRLRTQPHLCPPWSLTHRLRDVKRMPVLQVQLRTSGHHCMWVWMCVRETKNESLNHSPFQKIKESHSNTGSHPHTVELPSYQNHSLFFFLRSYHLCRELPGYISLYMYNNNQVYSDSYFDCKAQGIFTVGLKAVSAARAWDSVIKSSSFAPEVKPKARTILYILHIYIWKRWTLAKNITLQATKEFKKHDITERKSEELATHLATMHGLAVDGCQTDGWTAHLWSSCLLNL